MRLSPNEEYGLRCLLALARVAPFGATEPVPIESIASSEAIGYEHAAKILRSLRRGGFVTSARGANGGYLLARPADQMTVWDVLVSLDTPLVPQGFCGAFPGQLDACTHVSGPCHLRSLWGHVGHILQAGLQGLTLDDLVRGRLPGDLTSPPPRASEASENTQELA